MSDLRNTCFFCSELITNNKTQEHIIPNSLLKSLGIKEEYLSSSNNFKYQYSRMKVPAHRSCNNGFGSRYENKIIDLLKDQDKLFEIIKNENIGIPIIVTPGSSVIELFMTWLSKIYYGIFYHDCLKVDNDEWKKIAKSIIDTDNFRMVQNAYKDEVGFTLPSSLFVFHSNIDSFDLRTSVDPKSIMVKIHNLVFILVIEDGFLTKNYLDHEKMLRFQDWLLVQEKNSDLFPLHLYAFADILALRMLIPKTPLFIYSNKEITNMSLSTTISNPDDYYRVNDDDVSVLRNHILEDLGVLIMA